jgi:hypothetical protein
VVTGIISAYEAKIGSIYTPTFLERRREIRVNRVVAMKKIPIIKPFFRQLVSGSANTKAKIKMGNRITEAEISTIETALFM